MKDKEIKRTGKIVVEKSGSISGVNRFTCVPFAALELSTENMIFPEQAKQKEFFVRESSRE